MKKTSTLLIHRKKIFSYKTITKILAILLLATNTATAQTTVCFSIESEAEETLTTGAINLTSSDLELGADTEFGTPGLQVTGLRYTNFNLPANATVTAADIQFTADENSNTTANLTIKGELAGNAAAYNNTNFNVSNRSSTTAQVNWQPAQWATGAAGTSQQSPDLSAILNEVISNAAFSSGNAISFIINGTGTRTAENSPIELCVTYTTCGTPGQACNDNIACTINDVWDASCNCAGTPDGDSDNDGVCNAEDQCPGFNNGLIGTSCDDGDPNTDNDTWQADCSCAGGQQLVINEVFLSGFNGAEQTDHGFKIPDWIELYNASGSAINLAGWYLSDDQNNPQKWQIPSGTINVGDYRIFTTDGTNSSNVNTNFKIDQSELDEEVVLSDPSGNLVDIYKIRAATQIGHSRGRTTDGAETWSVFTNPTQNAANNTTPSDYAPFPDIDIPSGAHPGAVTVTVNVPAGFTARYELNTGNNSTARVDDPDQNSTAYTSPLTFNNTTVFKVRLYDNAGQLIPGFIETNTYLINENHEIYTLSVSGKNNLITLLDGQIDLYPTAHWEFFDETGELVTEVAGNLNKHGQDSWVYPQRGFDIFARDETGYGGVMKHKFYDQRDRDEFDRFIIRAAGDDNYPYEGGGAHIRDAFIQTWGHASGLEMDHRSYRPCVVYINGKYWGVYEIREKVVHKSYTSHYYDQEEDDLDYISYWGGRTIRYGSPADWDNTINYIFNNNMGNQSSFDYVDSKINLTSWTDYALFNNYIVSKDWNNYNSAWWRGRNPDGGAQKWQFILWDMDASFGHYINYSNVPDITPNASPCDVLNNSPISDPENLLSAFERLIDQNSDFRDFVANRYNDMLNTYWSCDYAIPLLDAMVVEKEPEMQRQLNRWPVALGGGNQGNNNGTYAEWQNHVQDIRDFMTARCNVIDNELQSCLNLGTRRQLTIQISPANAEGQIKTNSIILPQLPMTGNYYQNLPLGLKAYESYGWKFSYWSSNGTAISNSTADSITLSITQNDVITAHYVQIANPNLVINEIMYHPDSLCTLAAMDSTELDYIELKNTGTEAVNLGNCSFTDGLEYTFPYPTTVQPGDFLILTENATEFQNVYGFAADGQYKGGLSNDGERLELADAFGNIIDSLTFNDANPWDEAPDGRGPSLELLNPDWDNNEVLSWFRSDNSCGTPRAENSRICSGIADAIIINEINYNSDNGSFDPGDWVELHNAGAATVDISGWSFYDNTNEFVFPAGTSIGAGEFLVLAENGAVFASLFPHLNNNQYLGDFTFGLSNKGERISLFDENKCLSDYLVYNDRLPWDTIPDGNGPTLSLVTPNSDNTNPAAWESSSNINSAHGTPGRPNLPCPIQQIISVDTICVGENALLTVDLLNGETTYTWFLSGASTPTANTEAVTTSWANLGIYNIQLVTNYYECTKIYNKQIVVESCTDCIDVDLHVWLEGAYNFSTGQMETKLHQYGLLPGQTPTNAFATATPAGQPYNTAPWNYAGTEGANWTDANYIGDETDWVLVAFRTGIAGHSEIARAAAILRKDGRIDFLNGCPLTADLGLTNVYVVIEHRNQMGIMSPARVNIINNAITYDFRIADSYKDATSYGQKQLPTGAWSMFAGDGDQSDLPSYDIMATDKAIWLSENGIFSQYVIPDYNLDGDVNGGDKALWDDNNGVSSRVPK